MPPWHAEAPEGTFHERAAADRRREGHARSAGPTAARRRARRRCRRRRHMPPAGSSARRTRSIEMKEPYEVPARAPSSTEYFYIPTNLTEPTWVHGIEIRPSAREVVHHVLMYYWSKPDTPRTPVLVPNPEQSRIPDRLARLVAAPAAGGHARRAWSRRMRRARTRRSMPAGTAIRLEPGGVIELQMHYTTNGTAAKDRTPRRDVPVEGGVAARGPHLAVRQRPIKLPAGAADVAVDAEVGFAQDDDALGPVPAHASARQEVAPRAGAAGRHEEDDPRRARATTSTGRPTTCSRSRCRFRAGAKIVSTAWYDNSATNPANPNPKVDVLWGDQTWEEMQYTGLIFSTGTPSVTGTATATVKK